MSKKHKMTIFSLFLQVNCVIVLVYFRKEMFTMVFKKVLTSILAISLCSTLMSSTIAVDVSITEHNNSSSNEEESVPWAYEGLRKFDLRDYSPNPPSNVVTFTPSPSDETLTPVLKIFPSVNPNFSYNIGMRSLNGTYSGSFTINNGLLSYDGRSITLLSDYYYLKIICGEETYDLGRIAVLDSRPASKLTINNHKDTPSDILVGTQITLTPTTDVVERHARSFSAPANPVIFKFVESGKENEVPENIIGVSVGNTLLNAMRNLSDKIGLQLELNVKTSTAYSLNSMYPSINLYSYNDYGYKFSVDSPSDLTFTIDGPSVDMDLDSVKPEDDEEVEVEPDKSYMDKEVALEVIDKALSDALENTTDGKTVAVLDAGSSTKFTYSIFDKASGEDITLEIRGDGFIWSLDASTMKKTPQNRIYFNLGIEVYQSTKEIMEFETSKSFPTNMQLTINTKFAEGDKVIIVLDGKGLTTVDVGKGGNATFPVVTGGKFVIQKVVEQI